MSLSLKDDYNSLPMIAPTPVDSVLHAMVPLPWFVFSAWPGRAPPMWS